MFHMNELYHFGIKGQKWGVRRFQNPDGSLTPAGRERYFGKSGATLTASGERAFEKRLAKNPDFVEVSRRINDVNTFYGEERMKTSDEKAWLRAMKANGINDSDYRAMTDKRDDLIKEEALRMVGDLNSLDKNALTSMIVYGRYKFKDYDIMKDMRAGRYVPRAYV